MKEFKHVLSDGSLVNVEQVVNDINGNERYMITSLGGKFWLFVWTPKTGDIFTDYTSEYQKKVTEELRHLI